MTTQAKARHIDTVRLGRAVKELRKRAGFTQQELADKVGLHRTSVARLEAGRHDVAASTLPALAKALGVDPAALFDRAGAED